MSKQAILAKPANLPTRNSRNSHHTLEQLLLAIQIEES
jgi:hypothetical protein